MRERLGLKQAYVLNNNGRDYWQGMVAWMRERTLEMGYLDEQELSLFTVEDDVEAAANTIVQHVRLLKAQALSQ